MKVLIISHNPTSTYQSMGKTFFSLFSQFPKSELAQLYIYPSVSDVDLCSSYYRITDKSILKGAITRKVKGERIKPDLNLHNKFQNEQDRVLYDNPKNSKSFRLLMRDILWKITPWWNKQLRDWLDEIKSDCIFLAPGNCAFIYDIALKIAEVYRINIISYICDEYYFVKKPESILEKIRSSFVRKKIAETMTKSQGIITICDELKECYSNYFDKKTTTIMTGTNHKIADNIHFYKEINRLTYMGNLSCNRDNSIYDIGVVLDQINQERKTDFFLDIYTTLTFEIEKRFENISSIKLHDFVSGEEFKNVFWNAQFFLHIEDFGEDSIDRVKHSVSTKIADILASGIPLFAYGPSNIASITHLLNTNSAICVTSRNDLKQQLENALFDSEMRALVARNGLLAAHTYHDACINSKRLYNQLEEMSNENITG